MRRKISGPGYIDPLGRTRGWSIRDKLIHQSMPEPNSGCWLWMASVSGGYGRINWRKRGHMAHRLSYEVFRGPVHEGMYVCHKCDNRACINPDHLFLGTHGDNMADMNAKKRHVACPGERNGSAILTAEQALEIFKAPGPQRLIAEQYGVSRQIVSAIKCRAAWRSLTEGVSA